MKNFIKKISAIVLTCVMLFSSATNVNAQEYRSQRKLLTASSSLVISMSVTESGGVYTNGSDAKLYVDGVSGLKISNDDCSITKYGRGYHVSYR